MNRYILAAFLTICSIQCFSQNKSLNGKVFNSETGKSIKNALIIIEKENLKIDSLYSDRKGLYSFENIKTDTFTLVVKKKKFITKIFENVILNETYKYLDVNLNARIAIKTECYFTNDNK